MKSSSYKLSKMGENNNSVYEEMKIASENKRLIHNKRPSFARSNSVISNKFGIINLTFDLETSLPGKYVIRSSSLESNKQVSKYSNQDAIYDTSDSSLQDYDVEKRDSKIFISDPTPDIRIFWQNLTLDVSKNHWSLSNYFLPMRRFKTKRILKEQSGEIRSGTLTGLMGPSGAGKSTLLNCITGRYTSVGSLKLGGTISVTYPSDHKHLKVSFVPQKDHLFDYFTVKETLLFASKIKNVRSRTNHDFESDRIIASLNLEKCSDVKIGKCSGGQIKRVSIGVELISHPDVLVLDEPTSGLDSSNAESCIRLLKDLAIKSGPAIVCTIHQPNYEIFTYFNNIYLLSNSGNAIYFGPPKSMMASFAHYNIPLPEYVNPADYAIDVANGKFSDRTLFDIMAKDQLESFENISNLAHSGDAKFEDAKFEDAKFGDAKFEDAKFEDASGEGKIIDCSTRSASSGLALSDRSASPSSSNDDDVAKSTTEGVNQGANLNGFVLDANKLACQKLAPKFDSNSDLLIDDDSSIGNIITVPITKVLSKSKNTSVPYLYQTLLLFWRSIQVSCFRSPQLASRCIMNLIIAMLVSFMFNEPPGVENGCWRSDTINSHFDNESAQSESDQLRDAFLSNINKKDAKEEYLSKISRITDNTNFMFAVCTYILMVYSIGTVLIIPLELETAMKEMSNSWYRTSSYFIAKTIADLVPMIISILCNIIIVYYATEQISDTWRFLTMFLIVTLLSWTCESVGMMIGIFLSKDLTAATLVTMAASFPTLIYSGYLVRIAAIPWFFVPMTYLSYTRFAFEAGLIILYGFGRCSGGEKSADFIDDLISANNPIDLVTTLWTSFNITSSDANRFALLIGTEEKCMESVVNGTGDYLGLNLAPNPMDEYFDTNGTETDMKPFQPSYVLSYFKLEESFLYRSIFALCTMILTIRIITFIMLHLKTKINH